MQSAAGDVEVRQALTTAASRRGGIAAAGDGAAACHAHNGSSRRQQTRCHSLLERQQCMTHRPSRSRRFTSACPRRWRLGGATRRGHVASDPASPISEAGDHTHRRGHSAGRSHHGCSRRGCSRRSRTCLRQQQHVSHTTHDPAGEAATNGPQTPLTAAGLGVGAAAGAAACITHHSDARTVTAARTTGRHTNTDSDATSVALTAAAPTAPAGGTDGEAAA
jgi:hypothetical protein